jgi:hypothetical protein
MKEIKQRNNMAKLQIIWLSFLVFWGVSIIVLMSLSLLNIYVGISCLIMNIGCIFITVYAERL